jgi:formylglycine-generating enzyme required for sulfatase activity
MLFLSFAGENEPEAKALAVSLKTAGVEVWCSCIDGTIRDGLPYREQIYDALDRCTVFAVLLGQGAFDGFVEEEADYAIDRHNKEQVFPIVPLRLPGGRELPAPLKRFQAFQLPSDWQERDPGYFLELAQRFGLLPGATRLTPAATVRESLQERRRGLTRGAKRALVAGALLLALAGVYAIVHWRPKPVRGADGSERTLEEDPGPGPNDGKTAVKPTTPEVTSPPSPWEEVAERLAMSNAFKPWAATFKPQPGLVPLGPAPGSNKLEEFAVEGTGELPKRAPQGGVLVLDERSALVLVLLPPGPFDMGPSEREKKVAKKHELPLHRVTIPEPFFLAKTELSQAVYEKVIGSNPSLRLGPRLPVTNVDWNDAVAFCRVLRLRLPSEAEWEYACRAGTKTQYFSGDTPGAISEVAWHKDNSDGEVKPIATRIGNAFGLHDLPGNVWEWCEDTWHEGYAGAPDDGSAWVVRGNGVRVTRGGSAGFEDEIARSAARGSRPPDTRGVQLGFRPARSLTR